MSATKDGPSGKRSTNILSDGERRLPSLRKFSSEFGLVVVSDPVKHRIRNVEMDRALVQIQTGSTMLKYCQSSRLKPPHERFFQVDFDLMVLRWQSPKKTLAESQVLLADILRILPGEDSDFWRSKNDTERMLGIEILASSRSLRLVCFSQDQWELWFSGLLYAHQRAMTRLVGEGNLTSNFIKKQWEMTDLNGDGQIQFEELLSLLRRMNCSTDIAYAEQLFNSSRNSTTRNTVTTTSDLLDGLRFEEFKVLLQRLMTHTDTLAYFEHYLDDEEEPDRTMSLSAFEDFLREVQSASEPEVAAWREKCAGLEAPYVSADSRLTDLGFNALIASSENSIFQPSMRRTYQDMKRPLCEYFIASSHNTYLTSDQFVGRSAVGQYIDVLLKGCRCVELDCWDGADGEPVIFHGYTLTSKIPFEGVIKACKDYGFKKNPYPIILSLEMHCSDKQKIRIGQILTNVLGNSMYKLSEVDKIKAPGPADLLYKFLVKGKGLDDQGAEEEEGNEDDLDAEESELRSQLLIEFPVNFCMDVEIPVLPKMLTEDFPDRRPKDELKVYYDCISLPGKKLKSFEDRSRHAMHVSTINERKLMKMYRSSEGAKLVEWHHKYMSRIYPAGTRVMSSNYNPIPCWQLGCQMVALNYQAVGMALLLNIGKFNENGNCGWLLKPDLLRNHCLDPCNVKDDVLQAANERQITLTIQVLAGQQLPRIKRQNVNPSVTLGVQGVPCDTVTKKTTVVHNNGLNPRWINQQLEFTIKVPSLAMLLFEVRHNDAFGSEFLAGNALPINCIRTGLRWVPLYDAHGRHARFSGLIVHVTKTQFDVDLTTTASTTGRNARDAS